MRVNVPWNNAEDVPAFRRCFSQIVAVCVKSVLLVVYGITLGMPTMIIADLARRIPGEHIVLDDDGISWIGSLNYLSVPLGCLFSGAISKPFGRVRSMQLICILFSAAFFLYHESYRRSHIFSALFLTGFSGGLLEAPTLIYTVEISQPSLRGALCASSTIAIAVGVMLSFVLGTLFPWRFMALISGFFPLVALILLFFIPESPYWLIMKNRHEEARKSLAWLRGWTTESDVEEEFLNIVEGLQGEEINKPILEVVKDYTKLTFIKPFLLISFTFVVAYFGTLQLNVYAVRLFQLFHAPINSYYATIWVGVVELIGSILLMVLVRFLGKRLLLFISQAGVAIGFLVVGIYAYYVHISNFDSAFITYRYEENTWVPLFFILFIVFFSYLMMYTLPWLIMGELYPSEIRDTASGITAGVGYLIAFTSNKTFHRMVNTITFTGVFLFYSAVTLSGFVVLYFFLPETEGKTLFDITEHYAGRRRLSNKVGDSGDIWTEGRTMRKESGQGERGEYRLS